MSDDREQECGERCHLGAIGRELDKAMRDHGGGKATKFVAVAIGQDGQPRIFGKFNTGDLGLAIDFLLHEAAAHELDGCPNCDAIALAATQLIPQFRNSVERSRKAKAN